jgi:hypothetical protein
MKKGFIAGAVAAFALMATTSMAADVVRTESTTYSGTLQQFQPAQSRIIIKTQEQPQPQTYSYSETTKFIDADGNEITAEKVTEQVAAGSKATVYIDPASNMVSRVMFPSFKRTTTTTTQEID